MAGGRGAVGRNVAGRAGARLVLRHLVGSASVANVNWPTTERFGLTVAVTPDACWPLFSRPRL